MSGREPEPGLGLFAVLTGEEDLCRPEVVRKYFADKVGSCRIITSSRSYSNEKTFVTLEFSHPGQVRDSIQRYNNCKINGCIVSLSHFRSRQQNSGGGGGGGGFMGGRNFGGGRNFQPNSFGRPSFNNRGGGFGFHGPNQFNLRGNFQNFGNRDGFRGRSGPQNRMRTFGEQEAEKMRTMSPTSAARYIEQRINRKEKGLPLAYEQDHYRSRRGRSRSRSRLSSYDRSRSRSSLSRSRSRSYSRSPHQRSRSRSWRSRSLSDRDDRRSPYRRSHSISSDRHHGRHSDLSDDLSEEESRQRRRRRRKTRARTPLSDDTDSSSERRRHRRHKKRRHKKHRHEHSSSEASVEHRPVDEFEQNVEEAAMEETMVLEGVDEWSADAVNIIDQEPVKEEVESDELNVNPHLALVMPAGLLPQTVQQQLRGKRDTLEQEYQADVSTIISVTKMLVSHDHSLKSQLQNALKLTVDNITSQYTSEFEAFVQQCMPTKQ